jgi:asparagine synthase (glutamine-hydrolysing)
MCGFVGFIDQAGLVGDRTSAEETLRRMSDAIRHRGPDDSGIFFDESTRTGFGFRRLAILDLTAEGHQPMASASGRFTIAFNGEVYNFSEIREELESLGHSFRGHSDTEVMLAAFEQWGVRTAVTRFVGMFAFAVFDARERTVTLVRDRLGVKPLYWGLAGATPPGNPVFRNEAKRTLVFASELKGLRAMPGMRFGVDRAALALYLRFAYVPTPYSIHEDVRKLPPGHLLTYRLDGGEARLERYWSAKAAAERGIRDPFRGDDAEAIDAVDAAIRDSVRLRLISDVPLGAFLSGGIDSSAVVAAMRRLSTGTVKTFTIGFRESEMDESRYAREVARHLGTEHVERFVSGEEALATIPSLPDIWDEPFGDSSQIPTLLVSETARSAVTVSLSGDGGDELFGGYYRYQWTQRVWKGIATLPRPLRMFAARLALRSPAALLDRVGSPIARCLPGSLAITEPGTRLHKLARLAASDDPWEMYLRLCSFWNDESIALGDTMGRDPPIMRPDWLADVRDLEMRMMQADMVSYLVDDILVKVDRASMAVGLEAREPLLDHRLVELALRMPTHFKVRDGERKWVLRRVLERSVPRAMFERPKMGFSIPLEEWLRGPLRDWADALLSPERLAREGYLDPGPVAAAWKQVREGRGRRAHDLWNVLMFQAWLDRWGDGR